MNPDEPKNRFYPGFLHPGLSGSYVLTAVLSVSVFMAYYTGYGSWLRPFWFVVIPLLLLITLLGGIAGWLQVRIWQRLIRPATSDFGRMPLSEFICRSVYPAIAVLSLAAFAGNRQREERARRICNDCTVLVSVMEAERKQQGMYPTNVAALLKSHPPPRRKHSFYLGEIGTNGVEWTVGQLAQSEVSIFANTNEFRMVVPVERMSPISFSSFNVFTLTSKKPEWRKTLLHWNLFDVHFDDDLD